MFNKSHLRVIVNSQHYAHPLFAPFASKEPDRTRTAEP